jgi:hypothetical protein
MTAIARLRYGGDGLPMGNREQAFWNLLGGIDVVGIVC